MPTKQKKIFSWNAITTYYYYWHPSIQEYIFFEQNERKKYLSNYKNLENKMDDTIDNLIKNEIDLSEKEVSATLNITEQQLCSHKLNNEIMYKRNSKITLDKNEEKTIIIESLAAFINSKEEREQQIFTQDIYEFIGKTRKYIKINLPDIVNRISNIAKESKSKQKEIRRKNLVKVIKEIYKEYGIVEKTILSQHLGVSIKTLEKGHGIYKGIGQLIKKTIAEYDQN